MISFFSLLTNHFLTYILSFLSDESTLGFPARQLFFDNEFPQVGLVLSFLHICPQIGLTL